MNAMLRALARRDPLHDPGPLIRRVYAYAAYRMGDCADAEDVTSETFARALRYRDSYDASKGAPIAWLIGIARRCADEAFGQRRTATDPPDLAASGDLETEAVERLTLEAAVSQLGERDRELIALRYGADLSARQIAQRLELTTNAVEVALHRARSRLRAVLEGEPFADGSPALDDDRVRNPLPDPVVGVRRPERRHL